MVNFENLQKLRDWLSTNDVPFDDTSIFGDGLIKCQNCCSTEHVIRYHQNTRYVDCDRNWVNLCPECKKLNDEQWEDMWDDLHKSILYNSASTVWYP